MLKKFGSKNKDISILHCNSSYPTPYKDVNLNAIKTLIKKFSLNVGYSDHTNDNISSITAVALGAVFIEKHLNLNDKKETIDSFFSTTEDQFRNLITSIRKVEKIKGNFKYILSKSSKRNFKGRTQTTLVAKYKY